MAVVNLLSHEVSDLCIGKPTARFLPRTASVGEALAALKRCPDTELCIVELNPELPKNTTIAGKVGVADVIWYICSSEGNLLDPATALSKPVSDLLGLKEIAGAGGATVCQIEAGASLLDAIDEIVTGVGTLIVPIRSHRRKNNNSSTPIEFCCLTPEDLIRFLLNSISLFSHVATQSISSLGLIRPAVALSVSPHDPAISISVRDGTSVAVLSDNGLILGEISPAHLHSCDESAAAAMAALSAGEFLSYLEYRYHGSLPEQFNQVIISRLRHGGLTEMANLIEDVSSISLSSSDSSSDEESGMKKVKSGRSKMRCYAQRSPVEVVACGPESSLVAVIVQAIAHRVSYVWVVDGGEESGERDEERLVGVVTFPDILKVFRDQL